MAQPSPIPARLPPTAPTPDNSQSACHTETDPLSPGSAQRPTPSGNPPRGASSVAAPRDTSPLPAQSPASASRSSESVGPVTPAGRAVAGSPTGLTGTPPVVPGRLPATTSSCTVDLRSAP